MQEPRCGRLRGPGHGFQSGAGDPPLLPVQLDVHPAGLIEVDQVRAGVLGQLQAGIMPQPSPSRTAWKMEPGFMFISGTVAAALEGLLFGLSLIVAIGAQNTYVIRQGVVRAARVLAGA